MRLSFRRPTVWCINWSHPDPLLPRAAVQIIDSRGEVRDSYFLTWELAMAFANRYAEQVRRH